MKVKIFILVLLGFIFMYSIFAIYAYHYHGYYNYYSIPNGYLGRLVIREMPFSGPRPRKLTFIFNRDGFISTNYVMSGRWYSPIPYYRDPDGKVFKKLENGDKLGKNVVDAQVYFWSMGGAVRTPSQFHEGESWTIYFVGTYRDYLSAVDSERLFLDKYFK